MNFKKLIYSAVALAIGLMFASQTFAQSSNCPGCANNASPVFGNNTSYSAPPNYAPQTYAPIAHSGIRSAQNFAPNYHSNYAPTYSGQYAPAMTRTYSPMATWRAPTYQTNYAPRTYRSVRYPAYQPQYRQSYSSGCSGY